MRDAREIEIVSTGGEVLATTNGRSITTLYEIARACAREIRAQVSLYDTVAQHSIGLVDYDGR